MSINMSAVELAKQRAERQGGGNASFFSLKDGEKTYLRFLTGMVDSYVVNHSCGLTMFDFRKKTWDEYVAAGQRPLCPACGQPLQDSDIQYERSEHLAVDLHNYFPTSESGQRASFVCLSSETNALQGFVPATEDGKPMYQCPVCTCTHNINKQTGNPRRPSLKLYGIAVERDVVVEQKMVDGMMRPVPTSVQDVMVEEDGKVHPKLVIVQGSWNNFWQRLDSFSPDYMQSICSFDWSVVRSGTGMDTKYDLQQVSSEPTVVDMRDYAEWMPDVKGIISAQGNPEYYVKKGYQVPGYVPQQQAQQNAAGTAAAAIQNAAAGVPQQQVAPAYSGVPQRAIPMAQPVQQGIPQAMPQPMPQQAQGGSNDWSVVQNQFS